MNYEKRDCTLLYLMHDVVSGVLWVVIRVQRWLAYLLVVLFLHSYFAICIRITKIFMQKIKLYAKFTRALVESIFTVKSHSNVQCTSRHCNLLFKFKENPHTDVVPIENVRKSPLFSLIFFLRNFRHHRWNLKFWHG